MKTRMLSVFLAIGMLFVMLPLAVSAMEGDTADITVNVVIRGDTLHEEGAHTAYTEWLNTTVTVPAGTDAQTAVAEAADGYTLTGIESNYIYSVTNPDGVTLTAGESNSVLSGWMYDVNSESPTVAMSDYILADGDTVNFFWVDDYNEVFGTPDITVNVVIRGDTLHEEGAHTAYTEWLNTTVTVPAGTNAQTAVAEAADGYTLTGMESNYIYSVTNLDGVTLTAGESNSVLSGWMYDVNSESPTVAMSDYVLADGDTVNFFWVDDYNEVFGPAVPEMTFTDVSENDWFYADVLELYEAGVFCDAMETEILPHAKLDQGALLTYLWRAAGLSAETDKAIWSFDAIRWASENGICAANVDPEVLMTRRGIVNYLYLYKNAVPDAVIETTEPETDAKVDTFADGNLVDPAERAAFAWAIENGIVNGAVGADGTVLLNPDGAASHAEAIALIARLIK